MDDNGEHSLVALNKIVSNLEILCFNDKGNLSQKSFTNFSIHEILKPSFGGALKCEYDSDSAYTSDNCDAWSSSDEMSDRTSPRIRVNPVIKGGEELNPTTLKPNRKSSIVATKSEQKPFSRWTDRWRQKFEDDGYSSSDSESALDLRIERKKTPPKFTSQLPSWVFCTRYSDRPSAGPRSRRRRAGNRTPRRARTVFDDHHLNALNIEFDRDQYLSEERRRHLSQKLGLDETSIKIWFQNKRAKLKKDAVPHPLALQLKQLGLYNHKMAPADSDT